MHATRLHASDPGAIATSAGATTHCPACSNAVAAENQAARRHCAACGTIWLPQRRCYTYDDAYPAAQGHFHPAIGRCKQVTLQYWLRRTVGPVAARRVLEVGFGGGATLEWLRQQDASVWGQEPVAANRRAAVAAGIEPDRIKADLAEFAGLHFDLALYLDSFEHILDPIAHLRTLNAVTVRGSRALLVLPVADCLPRRLMGRMWPHDSADHWVFYSTRGLICMWQQAGWRLADRFYPWKLVSIQALARHAQVKAGVKLPLDVLPSFGVWLNVGERGLVFEKQTDEAAAAS